MMCLLALITAYVSIYVIAASVLETTEEFFCQGGSQVLRLKNASRAIMCEQSWSAESTPIARFLAGTAECHSPCINVTAGELIISGCVNSTLSVVCSQQGHVTEFRIHYLGIQKNHLPQHNSSKRGRHCYGICACFTLLLILFVAFSSQHCISQHCRIKKHSGC